MHMTFNEALDLLATGNEDAAWETARQDEGLSPEATKEAWIVLAKRALASRKALDEISATPLNHG
jgi:hypothetical protein